MEYSPTPILEFLQRFESSSNSREAAAAASHFADVFLAAGPNGAQPVKASDFEQALPKRFQLFASHGLRSTSLESVQELRLSARFVLADTWWKMTFAKDGGIEQVVADSAFIVDTGQEPFRIVFYLSKQDPIALLKARQTLRL
jgi:hypothetical protein